MSNGFRFRPYSNQEAFDRVWQTFIVEGQKRAVEQGEHPISGISKCVYRTSDGRGCAVGIQLPDALYHPGFENLSAAVLLGIDHSESAAYLSVPDRERLQQGIRQHFENVTPKLLYDLQGAHDDSRSDDKDHFAKMLRAVATKYNLIVKE